MSEEKKREIRPPSFLDALIPIIVLVILLVLAIGLYGDAGIGGPIQVALTLSMLVAGLVGLKNGHRWADMGKAAVEGISTAMGAIFILLAVGALIGTWSMAGTVATIVHLGIQFLSPNWYYLAAALICAVLALSIGSAWTVAGTLGVGLIGIAGALGVSPEITAGAVISGAYFGDKMSPLSETTNLAPAVAGTDLYTHIRGMVWTTVPSILIALVIFGVLGYTGTYTAPLDLSEVLEAIESNRLLDVDPPASGVGPVAAQIPRFSDYHPGRSGGWAHGRCPTAGRRPGLCGRPQPQHAAGDAQGHLVGDGDRVRYRDRLRRVGFPLLSWRDVQHAGDGVADPQRHGLWRRDGVYRLTRPADPTDCEVGHGRSAPRRRHWIDVHRREHHCRRPVHGHRAAG
jgi:hypothetical protein